MEVVRRRVGYSDLQQMPEDGRRYELYDGEVCVVPAPLPRHQRVAHAVADLLKEYERATGGLMFDAPIDIVLSEHNVVQPDVVFFQKRRRGLIDMLLPIRVPPDLAVEVLSPSTAATDRGRKMRLLAGYGVPEYWLVDPVGDVVELYTRSGDAYVLDRVCSRSEEVQSVSLPDLKFPAARIFGE